MPEALFFFSRMKKNNAGFFQNNLYSVKLTGKYVDEMTGKHVDEMTGKYVDEMTGKHVDEMTGKHVDEMTYNYRENEKLRGSSVVKIWPGKLAHSKTPCITPLCMFTGTNSYKMRGGTSY